VTTSLRRGRLKSGATIAPGRDISHENLAEFTECFRG
jgi:hypothetical protein